MNGVFASFTQIHKKSSRQLSQREDFLHKVLKVSLLLLTVEADGRGNALERRHHQVSVHVGDEIESDLFGAHGLTVARIRATSKTFFVHLGNHI